VFLRGGVERLFNFFAGILAHAAVEGADAFVGAVGSGQGGAELLLQVPPRVGVSYSQPQTTRSDSWNAA